MTDHKKLDPYEILGVSRDAGADAIKRAFRAKAQVMHPDKGGDSRRFQQLNEAHEWLSDPVKRRHYDSTGHMSFDEDTDVQPNAVEFQLELSLEELHQGCTRQLQLTNGPLCQACSAEVCLECGGRGFVMGTIRMNIFTAAAPRDCPACRGRGTVSTTQDCSECHGGHRKKSRVEVRVEPGLQQGDTVHVDGDVTAVIIEKPHEAFVRYGGPAEDEARRASGDPQYEAGRRIHLVMRRAVTITLEEALCGFRFKVHHLDGEYMCVSYSGKKHVPVSTGDFLILRGRGMLKSRYADTYGDLFVPLEVKWPERLLCHAARVLLRKALQNEDDGSVEDDAEGTGTVPSSSPSSSETKEGGVVDDDDSTAKASVTSMDQTDQESVDAAGPLSAAAVDSAPEDTTDAGGSSGNGSSSSSSSKEPGSRRAGRNGRRRKKRAGKEGNTAATSKKSGGVVPAERLEGPELVRLQAYLKHTRQAEKRGAHDQQQQSCRMS